MLDPDHCKKKGERDLEDDVAKTIKIFSVLSCEIR